MKFRKLTEILEVALREIEKDNITPIEELSILKEILEIIPFLMKTNSASTAFFITKLRHDIQEAFLGYLDKTTYEIKFRHHINTVLDGAYCLIKDWNIEEE